MLRIPGDEVAERERALAVQPRVRRVPRHRGDDERAAGDADLRGVRRSPQRHAREAGDDVLAERRVLVAEPFEHL